ncbi:MAG: hypothetical protein AB3N63_01570 [Puniceicoccaceae bacterium]
MKTRLIKLLLLVALATSSAVADLKLGDWYCIGPFKDEEFGNIDRSLDHIFAPEADVLTAIKAGQGGVLADASKHYEMLPFPGYLDLDRKWELRSDWSDGFYNLLPRGPAPSRNETVYMYRNIDTTKAGPVTAWVKFHDFYKIFLNGKEVTRYQELNKFSRYQMASKVVLNLEKGENHLLIKNVSRWAEHGFSFGIEGLHEVEDNFYYDVFAHSIESVEEARDYVERFKFSAQPIPMYSPAEYQIEDSLAGFEPTPVAAVYDKQLNALAKESARILAKGSDKQIREQASKLEGFLDEQVKKFPPVIFIKKPLHHQNAIAPYDNMGSLPSAICMIDPSKPEKGESVIYSEPDMRILDMSLSYDGKTIFFSGKRTEERYGWNIYEVGIDGKGLKQITSGGYADIAPFELPSGRIAFVSTRRNTYVVCQPRAAGLLYTMARDGSDIRLLSANIDSDHSPRVTNDGRILFTRWDYGIEKNVFSRHGLWTVNPDGTNLQLIYGNTVEDPGGLWEAWPIPGRPELLTVFGPHHTHHAGMIGLVWNGNGPEEPRGTGYRWITRELPVYGDITYADGYQNPIPLNEKQFLVSYGGMKYRQPWKKSEQQKQRPYETYSPLKLLYLDAYGNEHVIHEAEYGLSCYQPIPVKARPVPPVIPDKIPPVPWVAVDPESANRCDEGAEQFATMMIQDVYMGISDHVERGEAKYIAVMEQVQKSRQMAGGEAWGHTPIIGRGTVHARRLVGLIPVEEDGSAFFTVPALRSISLNVLNDEGKTLMRMGSDLHVMPNEALSCIGCHEVRETGYGAAPPMLGARKALMKAPAEPQKQSWGTDGLIDYATVIQPVWDKHCVSCHNGAKPDGNVNMTGDLTRFFNQSYDQLIDRDIVDHLSVFSLDHDEGTPNTTGAVISRIDEFMDEAHCGTMITWDERFRVYCWIDANVPYYGTNDYLTYPEFARNKDGVRGIGARDGWESMGSSKQSTKGWAQNDLQKMFDRRCADCHERDALNQSWFIPARMKVYSDHWGDKALTSHGIGTKWRLVQKLGPEYRINLTNPDHSLFLQAPLSARAGGVGLCRESDGSPVFENKEDPDYIKSLAAIQVGADRLKAFPRIDMVGPEGFMNLASTNQPEDAKARQFVITSHRPDTITRMDADGMINWQFTDIDHPQDFDIATDGSIFCSQTSGAKLIKPDGSVAWTYEVPEGCENPVAQFLENGRLLIGNEGPGQLAEINPSGAHLKTIPLSPVSEVTHGQFRFARKTSEGTYLTPLTKDGMVHEYAEDGTILNDFGKFKQPVSAVRLANGHTLIGSAARLDEFDADGKLVWTFRPVEDGGLPGKPAGHVTGLAPLEDGSIAFAFYHRNPEWPDVIVVNRKKEVLHSITREEINLVASLRVVGK